MWILQFRATSLEKTHNDTSLNSDGYKALNDDSFLSLKYKAGTFNIAFYQIPIAIVTGDLFI